MSHHFFDHLTLIEEIVTEIDLQDIDPEERKDLVEIALETLRHHSLSTILDHLPKDKHGNFLSAYKKDPENKELLDWLKSEITDDVEEIIKQQSAKIKKEILAEIKKSRV